MPIHRRLPKRGFTNIFKKKIAVINIRDLAKFESGSLVKGRRDGIKLLGHGEIKTSLTIKVNMLSKSAREKIMEAGGNIEVL